MPHSSKTLKAILDNLPEHIILISPEHKVLAFNEAFQNTVNSLFQKNVQVGDDYMNFVFPANKETYLSNFEKAINGKIVHFQNESKTPNFSVWVEYRFCPVYDDSNELIGITLTAKNIDKEKKAEIELEKLTETVNAIFESTTESILLLGIDGTLLSLNKAAADRIKKGKHQDLYIGADFRDFLYDKGQDSFFALFKKAVSGESTVSEVETVDIHGNPLWLRTKMHPTYKKNGDFLGVSITTNHITEKKLAEIALQQSEEKFKKIVESAPMAIIIADDQSNVILANPETETIFGYTPAELINQNIELLIPTRFQKKHKKEEQNYLENPVPIKHNIKRYVPAIKKNGEEIMIEASLNHYQLNNKTYIIATILDVTSRIQNEHQIADQLTRLQAIAWQQSHEIRRPLTNILGAYNLIQMETSEEEKQKHLDCLFKSAQELDQIIHNIVDHTS